MGEEGTAPKRMGRPRKSPEKGKRQNYTFRMSDSTRDAILREAEVSGRSMSEEIERRVEESFALGDAKALLEKSQIAHDLAWILNEQKIRQQIGEIAYLLYRVYEHSDRIYGENMRWFEHEKIGYIANTFGGEASRLIRSIGTVAMMEDARLHPAEDPQPAPAAEGGGDA